MPEINLKPGTDTATDWSTMRRHDGNKLPSIFFQNYIDDFGHCPCLNHDSDKRTDLSIFTWSLLKIPCGVIFFSGNVIDTCFCRTWLSYFKKTSTFLRMICCSGERKLLIGKSINSSTMLTYTAIFFKDKAQGCVMRSLFVALNTIKIIREIVAPLGVSQQGLSKPSSHWTWQSTRVSMACR